jgi:hypothetical protein
VLWHQALSSDRQSDLDVPHNGEFGGGASDGKRLEGPQLRLAHVGKEPGVRDRRGAGAGPSNRREHLYFQLIQRRNMEALTG